MANQQATNKMGTNSSSEVMKKRVMIVGIVAIVGLAGLTVLEKIL